MYPDEIATVQAVLRAYPDVVIAYKAREDRILASMSSGGTEGVRVQGGSGASCGDRYVMATEKDKWMILVRDIRAAVKGGMRGLNHKEADAIDAVYFRNLRQREASEEVGISVGYLSHVLDSAISKMAEYCIPVYPLVCRFRESIEQKRSEAVKAELETQKKEG